MPRPRFTGSHVIRIAIVAVALVIAAAAALAFRPGPARVAFSDFLGDVRDGRLSLVAIQGDTIRFERRDGARFETVAPQGYTGSDSGVLATLIEQGVRVDVAPVAPTAAEQYSAIGVGLLLIALGGFTVFRLHTGRVSATEKLQALDPGDITVTFRDVAGVDEAKDEVREIVDFLREPGRFASVGGRIPRGVLLVGPPGTGKTLLARSMAGEAGVPFISASGSDFVEMYAGVGAARVRRLFREARRHPACIVFIDELDAVGRNRGGHQMGHEEREQTLNQLLVEMDGFSRSENIVVVAATNRADILDLALLRPGRFDRQVTVGNPDLKGREQILHVHLRTVAVEADVDVRAVARGTPGFSGADLANVVNEAALLAARTGRSSVGAGDLDAARDKVLMGVERKSVVMSEHERVTCAYHEAGHAVVAAVLPEADPLHKVTIIPRGHALGVTMQLPEADRHNHSRAFIEAQIAILMGGRAAEELLLDQMTSGASNDIERATELAAKMVCELGMSSLGPVHFRRAADGERSGVGFSESTARQVDDEIRGLVARGRQTARHIVERERAAVLALAAELLDAESIDADRLKQILAAHVQPQTGMSPAA